MLRLVLLGAGLVTVAALVVWVGSEPVLVALSRITWWQFAIVCVPSLLVLPMDALGWRYAFPPARAAPYRRLLAVGFAGEALNVVTAFASVGGEAVKAWLLRRDIRYGESVPSLVINKTTTVLAQVAFLAAGVGLAAAAPAADSALLRAMLVLLAVEVLATGGFLATQVSGAVAATGGLLTRIGLLRARSHAAGLDRALRHFYRQQWGRVLLSVTIHLGGLVLGALETFVILWFLGAPVSPALAVLIEAVGSGVRFASFLVPASLGVLEGANVAAFEALALGGGPGLAFSLVRRARQVVWIALGLLVLATLAPSASGAAGASSRTV
jgi:hypothetical protein